MPPKTLLRAATFSDLDLLVDLGRATFYDTFVGTCPDEDMRLFLDTSFHPEKIAAELAVPDSYFYLLEDQSGRALGYSRLWAHGAPDFECGPQPVELVRFYLRQESIGTGLAARLMEYTLSEARRLGFRSVFLGVWEKNFRAQRFYEKWGFSKRGEKIFLVGTDAQTDWQYARPLDDLV